MAYVRKTPAAKAAAAQEFSNRLAAFKDSLDPAQVAEYTARFNHYSEANALRIVMQDPDATVVHGFHDWKNYGRRVKTDGSAKGTGIQILAFAGDARATADTAGTNPPSTNPAPGRMYFRPVHVFDIRHTEEIPVTEMAEVA